MPPSFRFPVIRGRPSRPRLRRDCSLTGARTTLSMRCQRLAGRLRKARSPRGLTFVTWHSRSIGKAPRCSSTNLNLTAFGSRRTGWLFSGSPPFAGETIPQTGSRIRLKSLRMRISRPSRYSPGKLAVLGRDPIRVAMGIHPWVQIEDADLAPKPLFSGQARGPRPRPYPGRDGHSPMGSKSTRRPPDHPQSDVAKARSSVQCAPHPCETHPSCLCPWFISFAAHWAIKGAPPNRDRSKVCISR